MRLKRISGLLVVASFVVGFFILPSHAKAASLNYTATENWDTSSCTGTVNDSQTFYYGVASGDTVDFAITNSSSTATINATITSNLGTLESVTDLKAGATSGGNTFPVPRWIEIDATSTSCTGSGSDNNSFLIVEGGAGTLACSVVSGDEWNVTGSFTNTTQSVSLYDGSQFLTPISSSFGNNTRSTATVNETFAGSSSGATYLLYNGASSSNSLLSQVNCPAVTPKPADTTPSTTNSTTPPVTPPPKTTTPSTTSTKSSSPADVLKLNLSPVGTKTNLPKNDTASLIWALVALTLLIIVVMIVGVWKTLEKAGRHGWIALIPIYNTWVLFEIGGAPGWWALIQLIPIVGLIALVKLALTEIEIAKRFGKSAIWGLLYLFLFGFIGFPILGFSKASYSAPHSQQ